jgi:hypothetical protein
MNLASRDVLPSDIVYLTESVHRALQPLEARALVMFLLGICRRSRCWTITATEFQTALDAEVQLHYCLQAARDRNTRRRKQFYALRLQRTLLCTFSFCLWGILFRGPELIEEPESSDPTLVDPMVTLFLNDPRRLDTAFAALQEQGLLTVQMPEGDQPGDYTLTQRLINLLLLD